MPAPASSCPRCGAPRAQGPECPRCGVIYAKARPRAGAVSSDPPLSPVSWPQPTTPHALPPILSADGPFDPLPERAPVIWTGELDDARRELLARAVAPPAALAVAWALVASHTGHALVRTFLSMWIHELGHAVAAWACGYGAFPGPWRTPVSSGRMPLVVALVAGGLGWLLWRGWRARRRAVVAAAAGGLVIQLACTTLPAQSARALFTFGGDGGSLALGALLVATLWADPEGPLGKGGLRWGFLAIGAGALVDTLDTWVRAWRDHRLLPLGEIEGVGLSDASTMMEVHGWSASALAGAYVALGTACLAVLAVAYAVALARALARVRELEAAAAAASRPAA